ncbi:ATPase [Methanocella sp. CWC-04]|uniref:ATPase n=1 Tax=Methanooceanicella nereidis TaxID=2052831 RepID=A0AAP2RF53_9EURY|nr:HAD-IC family P-type ATPase [Methanocella sp. CWC-04]MCD1295082.1 ATPase [Methanocella sp. CWC-04]
MGTGEEIYYAKTIDEIFTELKTGHSGLSQEEAEKRLETYGKNSIEKGPEFSIFKIIVHQFMDPLIYVLIIAAVITTLLGDLLDTAIILAVVFINAIIGVFQEFKAEKAISALKSLAAPKASVVRDNIVEEIDSENIVPGDIVLLASGTKVPADMRLFEVIRLEADESALTGESEPVRKSTAPIADKNAPAGEIINSAFMGTIVLSGRGKGVVIATGLKTQLGQISYQVASVKPAEAPIKARLERMSQKIGLAIVGVSVIAIIIGMLSGKSFAEMLLTGIALAVSAIPEGLPIVVTITMAIGVNRMAERNAIIRKLPAVETLGSTTVIASDKTGTMTKNEMTVVKIFSGGRFYDVKGTGFSPDGEIVPENAAAGGVENAALEMCLRAGLLSNESRLEFDEEQEMYKPRGDPTEVSLIVSAMKFGLREGVELIDYTCVDEIPFESERMYMASLFRNKNVDYNIAFIKGAPDRIIKMCDSALNPDGRQAPLDMKKLEDINDEMARGGLRILAMAYKRFPEKVIDIEPHMIEEGAVFLGMQGMYDPPREEVYTAIEQAKSSGIRVIMVTGDHKVTAVSIAKKLNIAEEGKAEAFTGQELESISDEDLYSKLDKVSVYSRVSPIHKLRIVQQLIKKGEIVAVTGDGVNDTPALKAAHIGIAMGRSGTDAAKESAEMVITDDNFASIFSAVKEGRVVFSNIRKVILFLLSSGLGEVILILSTLVMRLPLPLIPGQIIWMNLVTNGIQDVAMAFEPAEKGIEYQKPRPQKEPIISRLMMERLIVIGIVLGLGTLAAFVWQLNSGASIDKARTVALTTMVFYQLFNVFNSRSEMISAFRMDPFSNKFLFFSVVASLIAQVAIIYWEPMQFIFRTTALELNDWLVIIPVAFTVIIVVEIEKALRQYLSPR